MQLELEKKELFLLPNWQKNHRIQPYKCQVRVILPREIFVGHNYSNADIRLGYTEKQEPVLLLFLKNGDTGAKTE